MVEVYCKRKKVSINVLYFVIVVLLLLLVKVVVGCWVWGVVEVVYNGF